MDWMQANVTPLYKKGNRSEPGNYRPVSLTSIPTIGTCYLYQRNNDKQHGFRSSRSCESQLALTVNDLARILNDKGQVDIIIMDFCKVFDTVPHERLLAKISHAGISQFVITMCACAKFPHAVGFVTSRRTVIHKGNGSIRQTRPFLLWFWVTLSFIPRKVMSVCVTY